MTVRRTIFSLIAAGALLLAPAATALAGNPSGSGQPSVECGEDGLGTGPHGFATSGFANAETHYANAESGPAVSQYDVACYQLTIH
jgi:hypothetical protein